MWLPRDYAGIQGLGFNTGLFWGYIRILLRLHWDKEKNMETTIIGLYRV